MEKKNIVIIILSVLVIGLSGYIIYDKIFDDEEKINNNEIIDDDLANGNVNDSSDSKERPYVDGQIIIYYEGNDMCPAPETTILYDLVTNKITNFYIGGSIHEYADMVVENGKIYVSTFIFNKPNSLKSGKDSSYTPRTHTIEIEGEKISEITSVANSNFAASYLIVLTEAGNVYASAYSNGGNEVINLDKISDLKKLEVSNIQSLSQVYASNNCFEGLSRVYAEDYNGNLINVYGLARKLLYN